MTPLERLRARYPKSTLEALAAETGLSLTTIHALVHGPRPLERPRAVRARTLLKLAEWAERQVKKGTDHVPAVSGRRK